ncbi:MAG: DtxR family transcriptional regulator, Mn-dependent transcriptional regulator [Methanothermococcus sp.]|jgi:DtxR family Mn-dependent transcriptional regulator|uniref:metal-dependent transcriptional regulator n=1 Tax=Methanothermococcus TaxID=155862 RepID=UPI00036702B9|nr:MULTISPECIES: metal-dependent transcriptional regulator [Methanothermococcus]MDK2789937.1 DtxR family transcriptional regulator, Mn-dependent transcriptional regulator [Methanothermococcus sp.]MDK2987299.1 DtxR family transcriptional regulator, Mn-dependent transcriptional regulator [Methanothermococcus sp.]
MVSSNIEDYLEKICIFIKKNGRPVRTTELAKILDVKPAAITSMAKKLSNEGYIIYEPYVGIRLDKKGEEIAKKIIRKHRIIETFLTEYLKFDLDYAQEEACKIEHAVSDEVIERLHEFMGRPKKCPHGKDICEQ